MANNIDTHRAGLTLAIMFGSIHTCWAVLVALGLAEPLLDFVFSLHAINVTFSIGQFNIVIALALIAATSFVGYCAGFFYALVWNKLSDK